MGSSKRKRSGENTCNKTRTKENNFIEDRKSKTTAFIQCPDAPATFHYILVKAQLYLKIGPSIYRKGDYFNMPSSDWDSEILEKIKSGFEQIVRCRGYKQDISLEGVGVDGFYPMIATLHFELVMQRAVIRGDDFITDEMHIQHSKTGEEITLYNLVPFPSVV